MDGEEEKRGRKEGEGEGRRRKERGVRCVVVGGGV